jgi:nucleoside 2-deoxyribosyltransferase
MKAYLAGPDVFLPNAADNARAKLEICAKYGIEGRAPLDEGNNQSASLPEAELWPAIYAKVLRMMRECDIIVANLTPFRGASADAGTLVEVGWFLGQNKPVFGYSNSAEPFLLRSQRYLSAFPDPLPGIAVEGFGLADNLMIDGAVRYGGSLPLTLPEDGVSRAFDALDIFERCVANAAEALALGGFRAGLERFQPDRIRMKPL